MINKKIESISKNYKKYKINKNLKNDLTLAVAQRQSNLIRINYGLDLTANEYYSAVRESELVEQIEWQKIKGECQFIKRQKILKELYLIWIMKFLVRKRLNVKILNLIHFKN